MMGVCFTIVLCADWEKLLGIMLPPVTYGSWLTTSRRNGEGIIPHFGELVLGSRITIIIIKINWQALAKKGKVFYF